MYSITWNTDSLLQHRVAPAPTETSLDGCRPNYFLFFSTGGCDSHGLDIEILSPPFVQHLKLNAGYYNRHGFKSVCGFNQSLFSYIAILVDFYLSLLCFYMYKKLQKICFFSAFSYIIFFRIYYCNVI